MVSSFFVAGHALAQSNYSLHSPDQRIEVRIRLADRIRYDVLLNGIRLLQDSTLSVRTSSTTLGLNPRVKDAKKRSVDQWLEPFVRQKFAKLRENYDEVRLEMEGNYAIVFRAYNEGVGYRLETTLPQPQERIYGEEVSLNFAGDYHVYYPKEDSFFSHNEREFLYLPLKDIAPNSLASLPAVVDTKDGAKIAIAESDVDDYPGLWLRGNSNNGLSGIFPPYPLKEQLNRDRDFKITQAADYIAVTKGSRTFPWRILGIAEKDSDLITNQMVYLLAKPSQVQDTSWIKPGKVAWDWYNANNIYGVNFNQASIRRLTSTTSISRRNTASSTSSSTKAGTSSATCSRFRWI